MFSFHARVHGHPFHGEGGGKHSAKEKRRGLSKDSISRPCGLRGTGKQVINNKYYKLLFL